MRLSRRFFLIGRDDIITSVDVDSNVLAPMFFFQGLTHRFVNRSSPQADASALLSARQVLQGDCSHKTPRFLQTQ